MIKYFINLRGKNFFKRVWDSFKLWIAELRGYTLSPGAALKMIRHYVSIGCNDIRICFTDRGGVHQFLISRTGSNEAFLNVLDLPFNTNICMTSCDAILITNGVLFKNEISSMSLINGVVIHHTDEGYVVFTPKRFFISGVNNEPIMAN